MTTVCTERYHGTRVTPRGEQALYCLNRVLKEPSGDATQTQGSCSTTVSVSGGTHAGGDAGDLTKFNWYEREKRGRLLGFNIHHRLAIKNVWVEHVHYTLLGSTTASQAAKNQNIDWETRRGNGLANHGKATGYLPSVNIHFLATDEHTYMAKKQTQGYEEPNRIARFEKTGTTRAKGWTFKNLAKVTVNGHVWLVNDNLTFYDSADFTLWTDDWVPEEKTYEVVTATQGQHGPAGAIWVGTLRQPGYKIKSVGHTTKGVVKIGTKNGVAYKQADLKVLP
jgi:hypothetical protein